MFGAMIFLPQYFQRVRGISPTLSGLRLVPMLAGMLLTSIGSGVLISRIGRYKMFVVAGTGIMTLGLLWMTTIEVDTSGWVLAAMLFVVGLRTRSVYADPAAGRAELDRLRGHGRRHRGGDLLPNPRRRDRVGSARSGADRAGADDRAALRQGVRTVGRGAAGLHPWHDDAFLYTVPVAALAFGLSFLLRDVRLKTVVGGPGSTGEAPGGEAGVEVGSAEGAAVGAGTSPNGEAGVDGSGERAAPRGAPAGPAASLEPPGF